MVEYFKQELSLRHGEQWRNSVELNYAASEYCWKGCQTPSAPAVTFYEKSMTPALKQCKLNGEYSMHVRFLPYP
jgi:hypothetical protein